MEKVHSLNFVKLFKMLGNRLNSIFQGKTKIFFGGDIRNLKNSIWYRYKKRLVSKDGVEIDINVWYDKKNDDYLYYNYNIFFGILHDGSKRVYTFEGVLNRRFGVFSAG